MLNKWRDSDRQTERLRLELEGQIERGIEEHVLQDTVGGQVFSDLADWPGAVFSSLGFLGPLEALGSPLLSWNQATSFYLVLTGEESVGG